MLLHRTRKGKHTRAQACASLRAADDAAGLGEGAALPPAYDAGVGDGWHLVGPPHKQRYLGFDGQGAPLEALRGEGAVAMGPLMAHLRDELFASGALWVVNTMLWVVTTVVWVVTTVLCA